MVIQCPKCGSFNIKERNHAQKTLGVIGTVAGAGVGLRAAIYGSNIGMRLGLVAGPPGGIFGLVVGGIFGAFVSGSFGCSLGTAVGKQIDQSILDNYECFDCNCSFSKDHDSSDTDNMLPYHSS